MLVAAVAAVDHRDLRVFRREPRRAVARVADNDNIGVVRNDPDRIRQAFAFCRRADRRVGACDIGAAKAQHGAFERQARACRRLVKQARQDEFGRKIGAAPDPIGHVIVCEFLEKALRDLEDRFDLLIGEVVDRNDVPCRGLSLGH